MTEAAEQLAKTYRDDDRRQMADDIRAVLSTPSGRRLLMAAIGIGGVHAPLGRAASEYDSGHRDAAAELLAFANQHARPLTALAAQERTDLCSKRENSIQTANANKKGN